MSQIQKNCKGFPSDYMRFSYGAESYQTFKGGITFSKQDGAENMIEVG